MLDLQTSSRSVFGNDPPLPLPGCHRDDVCRSLPCQHGVCHGGWDENVCLCQESFTGNNCDESMFVLIFKKCSCMHQPI